MVMPLIPGLTPSSDSNAGGADAAGDATGGGAGELVAVLDSMSDEDVAQLVADAQAAADAGELEGFETPTDEASETPEEQAAEDAAGTEQTPAVPDDAGEEDEDAMNARRSEESEQLVDASKEAVEEIAAMETQLEQLADQADDNEEEGGDAAAVKEAIDYVEQCQKDAEDAADDCEKAFKKEDWDGCEEAHARVEDALSKAKQTLDTAGVAAAPGKRPEHTGPGEKSPLAIWAERVGGR
jgi:hypothetical protein